MIRRSFTSFIVATAFVAAVAYALEANQVVGAQRSDDIVAVVGDVKIRRQAVINATPDLGRRTLTTEQRQQLEAVILEKIIDRHIAFSYLREFGKAVGESEISVQLEALKAELAKYEKSIEEHLEEKDTTLQELEFNLAFRSSWRKYLKEKLTDENLRRHYLRNKPKLDGTDVRVAHLLLKTRNADAKSQRAKAEEIIAAIRAGTVTWSDAVSQHSEGSKVNAGELGVILKTQAMPPSFLAAAANLDENAISDPVTTKFGVHIIKCLEVIPGSMGWRDAKAAVTKDATAYLFETIVERHREKVQVERR